MSVIYKTLFEVKLLHEYYLAKKDGSSLFALAAQQARLNYLYDRFARNYPSIDRDVEFAIPPSQEELFQNYKIKLLTTYSGFRVAISVASEILADNSTVYKPLIPLPGTLPISILLNRRNQALDNFSNTRLKRHLPAAYYFSNRQLQSAKTAPFLCEPLPAEDPAYPYEQGELVFDSGTGKTLAFYYDSGGNPAWAPVTGKNFAGEQDRLVLPLRFYYTFQSSDEITSATFILKNSGGDSIKTITAADNAHLQKVLLDFTDSNITATPASPASLYTLEVSSGNGFSSTHTLLFADELLQPGTWAVVCIQPTVTDAAYDLLDADGRLLFRKAPDGSVAQQAPVFEIHIKSRLSFWRYINNKQQKILPNAALDDYLVHDAATGRLTSKEMRSASLAATEFKHNGATRLLPNPLSYDALAGENNRLFTDILVPRSALFDI